MYKPKKDIKVRPVHEKYPNDPIAYFYRVALAEQRLGAFYLDDPEMGTILVHIDELKDKKYDDGM